MGKIALDYATAANDLTATTIPSANANEYLRTDPHLCQCCSGHRQPCWHLIIAIQCSCTDRFQRGRRCLFDHLWHCWHGSVHEQRCHHHYIFTACCGSAVRNRHHIEYQSSRRG